MSAAPALSSAVHRGENADEVVGLGPAASPRSRSAAARDRSSPCGFSARSCRHRPQIDARIIGGVRLRHFLGAVAQAHDPRRRPLDQRLRQREEARRSRVRRSRREIEIELLRDVAGQFEMLLLVLANRHMRRPIDQNVGRHQHRIIVETDRAFRGPCRPSP